MTPASPYQGQHLIADLHGCTRLDDAAFIEACLADAADAAGACLIETRLHHFGPGQGVTGVALLAESHLSIHTWPEHGYAAIDIFMCGRTNDLEAALALIAERLGGTVTRRTVIERGFNAAGLSV
ncbi:adenosylmethionine decarboxylase [Sphingomonas sp. AOB5]|uniref:adenosylmethionine decarboxylase n=1 Tax=Sphingomonas sp. AOB5 TaxID=3034017 RepID=UPI0023F8A802|nr:adenosylmethionine decarboxylase [Sphingomonas sp. AOB5]MDF7777644.1 adenosylmethionine decarboxylase [Sphingomonas sp. AOB5]